MTVENVTLSKLSKLQLLKRDVLGRTVLHIAVASNDVELFRSLLKNPDIRHLVLVLDYESGWNILHYIFYLRRVRCLQVLLDHLENANTYTINDLLKQKDRSHQPPISLLVNDFKDLVWVPEYINERNKFHLKRRFLKDIPRLESKNHDWWVEKRGGSDAYVMGSNANNTLGVGDLTNRVSPTKVTLRDPSQLSPLWNEERGERRVNSRIHRIKLSKYHLAVILSGQLYTCGLGAKGRLGHGKSVSSFAYRRVELPPVREIALSSYHNVALTDSGVFTWGQNEYSQLGCTSQTNEYLKATDEPEMYPRAVSTGDLRKSHDRIVGVGASKIHSVAFGSLSIYFWGLNIGQMGFPAKGSSHRANGYVFAAEIVSQPKEVTMRESITHLATCETCTCIATSSNELFLFFKGQRVKLPKIPQRKSENDFDHFRPSRLTRSPIISKIVMKSHEHIHILLDSGDVLAFQVNGNLEDIRSLKSQRYTYAWRAYDSLMRAVDIDNSYDGSILLCTRNGTVFMKSSQSGAISRKQSFTSMPTAPVAGAKFKKVDQINRVLRVSCDDSFSSFGFIKDDVDALPFKLQKNDTLKDIEYLLPFTEEDLYRKQDQLLDTDHDTNSYVTGHFGELEDETSSGDQLYDLRLRTHHQTRLLESTFQMVDPSVMDLMPHVSNNKFCDGKIRFAHSKECFPFHYHVLRVRSAFCDRIFHPKDVSETFVHEDIEGFYDTETKTIVFTKPIDPKAVLAWLYFIYTNEVKPYWETFSLPKSVESRRQFTQLMTLSKLNILYGKADTLLVHLRKLASDEAGDTMVNLKDSIVKCHALILLARSAFFETILSCRWDNEDEPHDDMKYISLPNVTGLQFRLILDHLHGCMNTDVFNPALIHFDDYDEYANFLIEMIEIADELLLVQLKHLCELELSALINVDNVLVLTAHAYWLDARKLFASCCWHIFNNAELVLLDRTLSDLDEGLLLKIERHLCFLHHLKDVDFVLGEFGEVDERRCLSHAEKSEDITVEAFVTNLVNFNEIFMSDRKGFSSFEPLVDLKLTELGEEARRKLSRRVSRRESTDPALELSKLRLQSTGSESAIIDDEFEVVARRKGSRVGITDVGDAKSEKELRRPSEHDPKVDKPSTRGSWSTNSGQLPALGSRSKEKLPMKSLDSGPALGEFMEPAPKTRIKFLPGMKKSQRQRRQMTSEGQPSADAPDTSVSTTASTFKNPWKLPSNGQASASLSVASLPVLGEPKELPVLGQRNEPTLLTIMLQEVARAEEEKSTHRKTLAEIQQEQEFSRWWEEESKRVQQELQGPKLRRPKNRRPKYDSGNARA